MWWARKYGLPATDRRFLDANPADLAVERLADLLRRKAQLEDVAHDPEVPLEGRTRAAQVAREIDLALRDGHERAGRTGDPLIDRYEAQLAAGQEINLEDRHRE